MSARSFGQNLWLYKTNTRGTISIIVMASTQSNTHILTINAGSSSIKIAVYTTAQLTKVLDAAITRIGPTAQLAINGVTEPINAATHDSAATILLQALRGHLPNSDIVAVGHRIVHGGPKYHEPLIATPEILDDLHKLIPFNPEHLPIELRLIETIGQHLPGVPQIVCFDTGFHHTLPTRAQLLPIPRHLAAKGIRRYGFHGLSYAFILEELRRVEGEVAAHGKVIIAHLGSGASLAAIRHGKSIDTTMSLTPASGISMSTRSGDLDPGLARYLAYAHGYDSNRFSHMASFESGLLGISETTGDMEKLLELAATDKRAREAIDVFCYQIQKSIGSFAAALGGLNTLVFTGGIGEKSPTIRAKICRELAFLGINLDPVRNQNSDRLISVDGSATGVHVIHTDESATIARQTINFIHTSTGEGQ